MEYLEVSRVADVPEGSLRRAHAGGREILLAHTGGQFYAAELFCPHLGADLSAGTLRGTVLTCPLHGSQFDLRDGRVVRWTDLTGTILVAARKSRPPRPLQCYPVWMDGERILVAFP